ncbi:CopG family ribbon-helix-helix protein [Spirochaeta lutea]|uniref:Ribbon-helix-helix protein CopG domain-containing protein n=1 Tax=Spirochaeta lutea TaxID=1480694 RepID=A0A098R3C4_9SPIO|nr:ribbon-helix-helix domain-containing protein [Spirochaeta lutea]KGE73222.1 hypothetical protein DC28_04875 [Spirochaeta lutea]
MTTVRLNDEIDNKLAQIIEVEKTTKSEIIKKAISEYYEFHYQSKPPYELGLDFFGKYGSDSNLSTEYKSRLKEQLNAKHSH